MLRCNSPSSSELIDISKEQSEESEVAEATSETDVTLAEASEVAGTEDSWSELIGNLRVEESSTSELIGNLMVEESSTSEFSSRRTEKKEEEGSEGEPCETGSWVGERNLMGRRGLGFQIRLLGFGLGALLGLAVGEFPVFGRDLSLDECLGLDVGFGLVLELGMGFGFVVGLGFGLWVSNMG